MCVHKRWNKIKRKNLPTLHTAMAPWFSAVSDWTQCGTLFDELLYKSSCSFSRKQSKQLCSILVLSVCQIPGAVCIFSAIVCSNWLWRNVSSAKATVKFNDILLSSHKTIFCVRNNNRKGFRKWAVVKSVVLLFRIFLAPFYVSSEKKSKLV